MTDLNSGTRFVAVIGEAIRQNTKSGANIEQTYGQVASVQGADCSIYLAGSRELALSEGEIPEPSEGYRVPAYMAVRINDFVRVSIDARGHRWVEEVFPANQSRLSMDVNSGQILVGGGGEAASFGEPNQLLAVDATGNEVQYVDPSNVVFLPFSLTNVVANSTVFMKPNDSGNTAALPYLNIPWAFTIVGISVRASSARTAGSIEAVATIEGISTVLRTSLNATNTLSSTKNGPADNSLNMGLAGQAVGIQLNVSTDWLPITNYFYGGLYVAINDQLVATRVDNTFTASAVIKLSTTSQFFANAELVATATSTQFTADAVLAAGGAASSGSSLGFDDQGDGTIG